MDFDIVCHIQNAFKITQEIKPINNETPALGPIFTSLVAGLQAKNVLELGCRDGGSTLPLVLGAAITDGKVRSVDKNIPKFRHIGGSLPNNLLLYWIFHQSDTIKFLEESVENKDTYDIVLVDDWHSSNHVFKELCLIHKIVNNKSLVLLHDTMHTNNQPEYNLNNYPPEHEFGGNGVYGGLLKFMDTYGCSYEYSTLPISHGLTILRKIL